MACEPEIGGKRERAIFCFLLYKFSLIPVWCIARKSQVTGGHGCRLLGLILIPVPGPVLAAPFLWLHNLYPGKRSPRSLIGSPKAALKKSWRPCLVIEEAMNYHSGQAHAIT